MTDDTHDELELDTWQPLSTVTAQLLKPFHVKACSTAAATASLSSPHEKQTDGRANEAGSAEREKERAETQRAYVDQRIREIAAFERRARGH